MTTVDNLRDTLTAFLEELDNKIDDPHTIEQILSGDRQITRRDISSEPEPWTEDILIEEILKDVNLNKTPGRPTSQRKTPDFQIKEEHNGQTLELVGENKSLNKIEIAEEQLVDDYLSNISFANDGIATDGLDWVVYRTERGGDFFEHQAVRRHSFRDALRELARQQNIIGQQTLPDTDIDVDNELEAFALTFKPEHLVPLLTKTAPADFRDQRQKDVDDFFEVYIEVLFGESSDHSFDTCLRNDIIAPADTTRKDRDVFAATLVNRLLFIRFLEERGALPNRFLHERIEEYDESLPGTLYDFIIKRLFYDLFNEPKPRELSGDWYDDVPYLNGGLFRKNLENEDDYDVEDSSMILVIDKLIEGRHDLNFEIDPALLGSVFEMTINHISESEDRQKETGAYYTPNDVTHLINSQAVGGQVKETLLDAFAEPLGDDQATDLRTENQDTPLDELLAKIEDAKGWFGKPEGLENAEQAVKDLKVLDPACGSGHFLTAAMDELHQVLQSIHRGKNGGRDPSPEKKFEQKCDLALYSVYGVDVDPVATEIAKLRTWLKILEGNEWEEDYGRLPNIDVNILEGNSLIGLPTIESDGMRPLTVYSDRIDELLDMREEYKDENLDDKTGIDNRRENLRDDLNEEFITRLTYTIHDEIKTADELEEIVSCIDPTEFTQYINYISIKRTDDNEFTGEQKDELKEAGFNVHHQNKSAQIRDTDDHFEILRSPKLDNDVNGRADAAQAVIEALQNLLETGDYYLNKVKRRPVTADLEAIEGHTFHWIAEFPEARIDNNGTEYEMGFDVVVGNPPYGDILSDEAKNLVDEYKTGSLNQIAAQFVERQIQLLRGGGSFGNIHTLGLLYQGNADSVRDLLATELEDGRMACYGTRPSKVFAGAGVRCGITTGEKASDGTDYSFETSEMILFHSADRDTAFKGIEYESVEGLVLGDRIGDEEKNSAFPKVGTEMSRWILETLRDSNSRLLDDAMQRSDSTEHIVWRSYHPRYWINPFLEDLYTPHPDDSITPSRDFEPMYFDTDLERKAAFILMQSSTFYHYWMTYENQRDINWGPIEAFPFVEKEDLEPYQEEIEEIAEEMWDEMRWQFNGKIPDGELLKPMADRADDVLGPLLGLSDEQVEWLKDYHTEFGRAP